MPGEPKCSRAPLVRLCNAICNGARKTDCDRSDLLRRAHTALHRLSVVLGVLRRDRSDPLGLRHLATDQKVGGSNPSERAKVLVTALLSHVGFLARPNLAHKLARTQRILTRPETRFPLGSFTELFPTAQHERHSG
jgi:hypothetical protein